MQIPSFFKPVESISDEQRKGSLRYLTLQAVAASSADGLASGGFLAAFALAIGASNIHIGIMTAIPFILQPLQILAVILVERTQMRKIIALPSYLIAFAAWIPIATIPFIIDVPNAGAVVVLLFFIALRGAATAFVNTSWTSWLRDMAPADGLGGFFAQRMRVATISAAVAGLLGALYIDWWKRFVPESEGIFGYSYAMLLGSILLGFTAVGMMSRIREPRMPRPEGVRQPVLRVLAAPFRDQNFKKLIHFLFAWNLVSHLAVPFFAVYMLVKLELSLTLVVGFTVLSQLMNVLFLRVWGSFSDQFGSKVILSLCTSLYLLVILGWTFTTMPDKYLLTIPLLIFLHCLVGIASAGINVSTTTIRMKLAPQSQATSYLTGSSLAANLGAGIGPLLGGAFVDFFSVRQLQLNVGWIDPARIFEFPALFLTGYDFLFFSAFLFGLLTLSLLARVQEEGEVDGDVVMNQLMTQTRQNLRSLNFVPGLGTASEFPISGIRYLPNIPGLRVAAGVTAYQLASSTKATIDTIAYTGATANQIRGTIGKAVTHAGRGSIDATMYGTELAFGAAQGAVAAAADATGDKRTLVRSSIRGTLNSLIGMGAKPLDAIRGSIYGTIYAAMRTDLGIGAAVADSIAATRQEAEQLGLSEEEAVIFASEVAMEAADELSQEYEAKINKAVLDEIRTFL